MSNLEKFKPKERFSKRASLYTQARPDYPPEALDFICRRCSLSAGMKLADIGCGTGISSRALAARGIFVRGLEPNSAMLDEAMGRQEFGACIEYKKGSAENTGLSDESMDAVLSAQAFHWFDPLRALKEFNRILKPGGWIILIWNERDESDEFTRAYGSLLRTLPDTSLVEVKRGEAALPLLQCDLFQKQERDSFANRQEMDLGKLVARAFSSSYAPDPDSIEALPFEDKLSALFRQFQSGGKVSMKYECSVYTAQKPA